MGLPSLACALTTSGSFTACRIASRRIFTTCGGVAYPPVPALTMNGNLRTATRGHSEDMATQNYFSHTSLDGRTFSQRISNAGYTGAYPWGENIAAGQPNPTAVVDGWMASTGHCQNIMHGAYRTVGVGYAFRAGSPYYEVKLLCNEEDLAGAPLAVRRVEQSEGP